MDPSKVTGKLASYISQSGGKELPSDVMEKTKHHILDSLSAVVFGSSLKAGRLAISFVQSQGGIEESQVAGTAIKTTAINAALANGIMGHAAEVDDLHSPSLTHAGIAVVPAAMAAGEKVGIDGIRFIRGVVAGYDIACRINYAIGVPNFEKTGLSSHSVSGTFGAATAVAAIMGLDPQQIRYVLSYAVQQASGSLNWHRDKDHVEKAFVYGGMPARNGVTAAIFAGLGFTGVEDPFHGRPNYLYFFNRDANQVKELVAELATRYEIMDHVIKKHAVGGPIQAPLDGLLIMMDKYGFGADDVEKISIGLSQESKYVVDDREMPNVNLQYILSAALLDGESSYEATMDYERMNSPDINELKKRISLFHEPGFDDPYLKRQAIVEVVTKDGKTYREHIQAVRGRPENPMSREEVGQKSMNLMDSVLGKEKAKKLIDTVMNLEQVSNMRDLQPLMSA